MSGLFVSGSGVTRTPLEMRLGLVQRADVLE